MINFIHGVNVLLPLLYGMTLALYAWHFFQNSPQTGESASRFLLVTIFVHLSYLIGKGIYYLIFPIATIFASMSMFALNIAIIYFAVEKITRDRKTGIFFTGLIFCFQLVSSMLITFEPPTQSILSNPMFGIHTTLTLFGVSALAISAIYSVMYLMLAKEIKRHRFGLIYDGLPALETLENMSRYATGAGIILLGLGLFTGHLWSYKVLGYFFKFDPKIIVSDLAWFGYLIGWILVKVRKLHGLKMSRVAILGFLSFLIILVIANFLDSTFHNFV